LSILLLLTVSQHPVSMYNAIDVVEYDFPIDTTSDSGIDETYSTPEQNTEIVKPVTFSLRSSAGIVSSAKEIPHAKLSSTWSPMTGGKRVHIPEFIFSHAEVLRREKKMTLEEISEYLRQEVCNSFLLVCDKHT
jgi:hypothetical protein